MGKTKGKSSNPIQGKLVVYSSVAIVAAAVVLLYLFSSSPHGSSAIASLMPSNGNTGILHLVSGLSMLLGPSNSLNVTYSGNLTMTVYAPNQNGTQQALIGNIPITISYMKFGNYSRLNVSMSIVGNSQYFNSTTVFIMEPNGTYTCPSSNFAPSMPCQRTDQANLSRILSLYVKDATSSVRFDGIRSYNGNSCSMVNGRESVVLNTSKLIDANALQSAAIRPSFKSSIVSGTFSSCISNIYFVPLNLSAYNLVSSEVEELNFTVPENITLGVNLKEVSINGKASIGQIEH